jgi:cytochrome c biogenesis protein CcmG/thiol:disulfide interchange protein DsbE
MRFLITIVALLASLSSPLEAFASAASQIAQGISNAPDFSRADLNHKEVSLAAYHGKVILLNFWATWCAPCIAEIPRFAEWQHAYGGQGLQVIGISMDDEEQPVRAAYQKYQLNYPVVMGDETLGELYGGILGMPVTMLIDRRGKIRFRHQGAIDFNVVEHEIQGLLLAR